MKLNVKNLLPALGMLAALGLAGCKAEVSDVLIDEKTAVEFLNVVFPARLGDAIPAEADVVTDRFGEYSSLECDYDPVYCTQDSYSYQEDPLPEFEALDCFRNAYLVTWSWAGERVRNIVVLATQDGRCLIDNVLKEDGADGCVLLFDYSKPAESIWAE